MVKMIKLLNISAQLLENTNQAMVIGILFSLWCKEFVLTIKDKNTSAKHGTVSVWISFGPTFVSNFNGSEEFLVIICHN